MTLSQMISERFDEITEQRGEGASWSEISRRIAKPDVSVKANSVYVAYQKELTRRQSPKRAMALRWVHTNYESIRELVELGYDWAAIPILLPVETKNVEAVSPPLSMLIREFKAIDKARAALQPGHSAPPDPASQPTHSPRTEPLSTPSPTTMESHVLPQAPEPQSELSDPVPDTKALPKTQKARNGDTQASQPTSCDPPPPRITRPERKSQSASDSSPTPAQSAVPKELPPDPTEPPAKNFEDMSFEERMDAFYDSQPPERKGGQIQQVLEIENAKRALEAQRRAEKEAALYHKPYHEPVCDPYTSAEEYRNKRSLIVAPLAALLPQLRAAKGDEKAALQYQADEIHGNERDAEADFFTRFCHRLATKSALCILSSAALASGVFTVCDAVASDTSPLPSDTIQHNPIKLLGYDRPDHMHGDDSPDPLYIIENFTQAELAHIAQAYETDKSEFPEFDHTDATPLRRLTEALVVRGVYLWRYSDWIDYDKYIKLKGPDFPSPTLTQSHIPYEREVSRNRPPVAEFAPQLTGTEPDRDKLKQHQREALVDTRGKWLGHAI